MRKKHTWLKTLALACVLMMTASFPAAADDRVAGEDFHTWEMADGVTGYASTENEDTGYSEEEAGAEEETAVQATPTPAPAEQEETVSAYDENHDGDDTFVSNNGTVFQMPTVDSSARIYDFAGLLTDEEEADLRTRLEKAEKEKDIAIFVLTTEDIPTDGYNSSETTRDYLTEFYVFNHFPEDGFAFVIDMNNRWLYTVGHGKYGDSSFNDTCTAISEKAMVPARNGDYAGAARTFVNEVHKLDNLLYRLIPTPLSLLVSAVLSAITLIVLSIKHKSSQPSAANVPGIGVNQYRKLRHDVNYLGTTRTVRHIERTSSGGGGGGFSSGGGGTSGGGFSGGGGSFSGGGAKF